MRHRVIYGKGRARHRVFDRRGQYLGEVGDDTSPGWGASLYELLHPFTVQSEYVAAGKPEPSVSDVMDSALTNISKSASETIASVQRTGKVIAAGVVVLAVAYVVLQVRRKRR